MGSKLLFAGNAFAFFFTLAAFLQALSWPIAGVLIIVSTVLSLVLNSNSRKVEAGIPPPVLKALNHLPLIPHERPTVQSKPQTTKQDASPNESSTPIPPSVQTSKILAHQSPTPPTTLQSEPEPKDSLGQEQFSIEKGDYLSFDIDLDAGQQLIGEVSAEGLLNVYVLTEENLASIDAGEEFWSETCQEGVEKATVRYTASEKGTWFLVVENADDEAVSGTINVRVELDSRHSGEDPLSLDSGRDLRRELSMGPRP